jgi:D-aminopeptidase
MTTSTSSRKRLRDLGIAIGRRPPGPLNAITDVAGVRVGHATVIADAPQVARTGVTVVLPGPAPVFTEQLFAAYHVFNGFGEVAGLHWIAESGLLTTPIVLTSSFAVGVMRDAMMQWRAQGKGAGRFLMPVVAETNDGWLHDAANRVLGEAHLEAALAGARDGPVIEGNVGGGTGMICHDFKGGIGTSSRLVELGGARCTVGALVQANYGNRVDLTVAGVPVGRALGAELVPLARPPRGPAGSIIGVIATDAPLLPGQLARLARRATVGLGRVGGNGANGSGDIFLAFSTANRLPVEAHGPIGGLAMLPQGEMDPLFDATAEAIEEAIVNALCMAETMTGQHGRTVHALPLDQLSAIMRRRGAGDY